MIDVYKRQLFDMPKRTVKSLTEMAAFYGIEVEEPIILDKNYRLAANEELSFMEQQLFRKRRCSFKKAPKHIHIDCLRDPKQELTKICLLYTSMYAFASGVNSISISSTQ